MKYILTKHTISPCEIIEISRDEYEQCKKARKAIFEALHIEEKMNMIIENFREFEMVLLGLTMKYSIYEEISWSGFNEEINIINRKLANLLTACRIYSDQLIHHIKNIYGPLSRNIEDIEAVVRKQYNDDLGYRVIYALRNYVQHSGFAVYSLSHASSWNKEMTLMTDTIVPSMFLSNFEGDDNFKKSVLEELRPLGNEIDIRPFVRTCVASYAKINEYVRNNITEDSKSWEVSINTIIEKYPGHKDKTTDIPGLIIAKMTNDGSYEDIVYIFREHIRRWKRLERLNAHIKYFPKRRVTN